MSYQEAARTKIETALGECARARVIGKNRLAYVRHQLLGSGFDHRDTLQLVRDLGFETTGLHIVAAEDLRRRRRQ